MSDLLINFVLNHSGVNCNLLWAWTAVMVEEEASRGHLIGPDFLLPGDLGNVFREVRSLIPLWADILQLLVLVQLAWMPVAVNTSTWVSCLSKCPVSWAGLPSLNWHPCHPVFTEVVTWDHTRVNSYVVPIGHFPEPTLLVTELGMAVISTLHFLFECRWSLFLNAAGKSSLDYFASWCRFGTSRLCHTNRDDTGQHRGLFAQLYLEVSPESVCALLVFSPSLYWTLQFLKN